jgi:HK97 gp10 family phage protein
MKLTVKITGGEELARKLAALSDAVAGDKLASAAMAGALPIQNRAKELAPYKTGTLRRSIHSEIEQSTRNRAEVAIGTDVEYAAIQEFGGTIRPKRAKTLSWIGEDGQRVFAKSVTVPAHPYLRPALDEEKDTAVREIGESLRILLEKA